MTSISGLLITSMLLFAGAASGQDTGGGTAGSPTGAAASQSSQGSLLPEINPQDIEIRSQYKARFPGVNRQPILGFKPRPRVYQIDPSRIPYLEGDDAIRANLPVSALSGPLGPSYSPFRRPDPVLGVIRLGAGSLGSPELSAAAGIPLGGPSAADASSLEGRSWLSASLDAASLDAYPSNRLGDWKGGTMDVAWKQPVWKSHEATAGVGLTLVERGLFELPDPWGLAGGAGPVTRHQGVRLNSGLGTVGMLKGWDSHLDVSFDRFELAAGDPRLDADMDELSLSTRVVRSWPGRRLMDLFSARLEAGYRTAAPSAPGADERETIWFRGGLGLERLFDFQTTVEGQASLLMLLHERRLLLLPEFDLQTSHPLTPSLIVHGGMSGAGTVRSLPELMRHNPYLHPDAEIRHSYDVSMSGEVRLSLAFDMQIRSGARIDVIHNHPGVRRRAFAVPSPAPPVDGVPVPTMPGYYELAYEQAAIPSIFASVTQPLIRDRLWADAGIDVRWPLVIGGGTLPYEESLRVQGSLHAKPLDRLTLTVDVLMMDRRSADDGASLDGFVHLAADARMRVFRRWSVHARVDNLLDERYMLWDPAFERPFEVFAGISMEF